MEEDVRLITTAVVELTGPDLVVWLDPGKMTGWASMDEYGNFSSGQSNFEDMAGAIESWCVIFGPALWLGWERYNVTQGGGKTGTPEYSLEMIGVAKWLCYHHGVTTLKAMPSSARKLGDELKLKRLGWRRPGMVHANDAASHLLAWALREKRLPQRLLDLLFTPG
jgi:hypothetical protein